MDDPLSTRVSRYLNRHMDWMREVLGELEALERAMGSDDAGDLLDTQARRTREAEHFGREHAGLLREWNGGAGEPVEGRAAVKRLAREAEELAARLQARYQALLLAAAGSRQCNTAARDALRRGRDVMQKYRPGGDDDTSFLDRKA